MSSPDEKVTLTLGGQEIETVRTFMPHAKLKFYADNPRIYTIICAEEKTPSQREIEEKLIKMDHVLRLIQSIKANGGLIDPLLVRDGDFVVLEGNSRLAAYRLLEKKDPIKWGKVKCCILPAKIPEKLVFALLGEYHIIGRKDWAPYEQAGYLWRRVKHHNASIDVMAKEMGVSKGEINSLLRVYSFMVEKKDSDVQHWSYYDEFLKSQKITKQRKIHKRFDDIFVQKVKTGKIPKAIDVRDKVAKIAEAGGKAFKKFIEEKASLDDCYELSLLKGVSNVLYKHLYRFRSEISQPDIRKDLKKMPKEHLDKCEYELKRIKAGIDKLLKDDLFHD